MKVLVCVLTILAAASAAPSPGGRIIGGWDAERAQFPYQISAQYCRGASCSHSCGGVILSDTWVLTAAHCITDVSGGEYRIVAGILNLDDTNAERQEVRVVESLVHPDYQGGVGPHDLGLWRLERPLDFNDQVFPVTLPQEGQITGREVVLSGWGSIGTNIIFPIMPNRLQTVTLPIVPQVGNIRFQDAVESPKTTDKLTPTCSKLPASVRKFAYFLGLTSIAWSWYYLEHISID